MVKYWLRWLAVLPGAVLAGMLALFPLRYVVYTTLSSWIEPYPELPERLLTQFVIACVFVWAGGRIAPDRKIETSVVLLCIWIFLSGGFTFLAISGDQMVMQNMALRIGGVFLGVYPIRFQYGGLRLVLGIVGAVYAVWLVKQDQRKQQVEAP
jgi:hypothetical protein